MAAPENFEVEQFAVELAAEGLTIGIRAAKVVAKTAHDTTALAQQLVPVDTSATKQSIHPSFENGGLVAEVGPTTEYAYWLEYGTTNMAPHAFMGPAFDRHAPDFVEALARLAGRDL